MTSKGCVLDLRLDDEGGTTAHDYSRYGNDGTLTGCKWVENGIEFNGSSDYIDCGNDASLDITDAITISAWVKMEGTAGSQIIVQKSPDTAVSGYFLSRNSLNKVRFAAGNGINIFDISSAVLNNGIWYNIVATYNNTEAILYINGIKQPDVDIASGNISIWGNMLRVGRFHTAIWHFNGSISDVRIYNYALTPHQIEQQYDSSKHRYK